MEQQDTNLINEDLAVTENRLIEERKEKLKTIRKATKVAFPNDFKPSHKSAQIQASYEDISKEDLENVDQEFKVAGRMMLQRLMGKASFATIQDATGRLQLYVAADSIGEEAYEEFKGWDLGDIIAAHGTVFKTKTGELSLRVTKIRLLTKSLRPLPDKFHGVTDQELKYRQRYVDLIMNDETRQRFGVRSRALSSIRQFMLENEFLEVETPMLHPIPGGANARPFITHHNALDQEMFLRVAPELYLKRLIVGGYDRVFEINRNYRNEGVSARHNPEFTMMEFYATYWDYQDLMTFTEDLLRNAAVKVLGTQQLTYQGRAIDLEPKFDRLTIPQAIEKYTSATAENIVDREWLITELKKLGMSEQEDRLSERNLAALQVFYFEELVEEKLWKPTFIMDHPTEISPLARANDNNPDITERFELYMTGREIGNGFSELNDAQDQAQRFLAQVEAKDAGDDEAMFYDHDFVRALEYGMPPTGGCGVGIDRFMMILTDSPSIRDVIFFPTLRKEQF